MLGLTRSAIPGCTTALVVVLLLTAGTLISCSSSGTPGDGNEGHTFSSYTEDGIEVSVTSGVPKYTGQLFEFEEEVRLHQDEDRPESLLNQVSSFARGEDGRYYVPDRGDNRIAVYDGDGEYLFSFGREGEGPGEFRSLLGIEISDGRISTFDTSLKRSVLFTTDGELIAHYRLPGTRNMDFRNMVLGIEPLDDGRLVVRSQENDMEHEYMATRSIVTVFSADLDTLCRVEGAFFSFGKRITVGRSTSSAPSFYGPQSVVSFQRSRGIFSYHTIEPVIKWYDFTGDLIRVVRMDTEPDPVTEGERRGIARYLQKDIDEADDNWRAVREEARRQAVIPDVKSYWDGITVDSFGYHWIRRNIDFTVPDPYDEPPETMLLSPEGEYLGDATYPMLRSWVSQGYMLAVHEDEESGETDYIVYRMIPIPEGFIYP